jgi:hypothetical protein
MGAGGMRGKAGALGLAALVMLAPVVCSAQQSPAPAAPAIPDKSGYSLADPTPADQLRSLCTDRPTKSTGACTVDAGHFQYESDIFNVTLDRSGGVDTDTYLFTNPTLKLGLTNTVDIELNMVPVERVTTKDRTTGQATDLTGVGDLFARAKINLTGDDGGNFAASLVPYIKAPTARRGIGNGAVEAGLIAPLVFNLPQSWQLTLDPEVDVLENAAGDGRHVNVAGLASFSKPLSKTITASLELWSDVNFDPAGSVTQYSFDLGAAWIPEKHPNIQLDGGVNLGLNKVTPGAQLYVGLSQRF